jgi:AcrR family transcriptional regulator
MSMAVSIRAKPGAASSLATKLGAMVDTALAAGAEPAQAPKGERTRESILRVAVNLASVEGLEGVTIGRLADELRMSKSGLFAHFGSKEELQLATVDAARKIFIEHVVRPALASRHGMPRLWALCDHWLGHVEQRVFLGGCFFTAASFEFDSRPGPVRNRIVAVMKEWLGALSQAVEDARKLGHIKASVVPRKLAFEIYSLAIGAHWGFQLLGEKNALKNARSTIRERLRAVTTPRCPRLRRPSSRAVPR